MAYVDAPPVAGEYIDFNEMHVFEAANGTEQQLILIAVSTVGKLSAEIDMGCRHIGVRYPFVSALLPDR